MQTVKGTLYVQFIYPCLLFPVLSVFIVVESPGLMVCRLYAALPQNIQLKAFHRAPHVSNVGNHSNY